VAGAGDGYRRFPGLAFLLVRSPVPPPRSVPFGCRRALDASRPGWLKCGWMDGYGWMDVDEDTANGERDGFGRRSDSVL
jgi:hypothetical protein